MSLLKVTACLAVLVFCLAPVAEAADVTYSGIPGKWKRGKEAKATSSEAEAKPQGNSPKQTIDNGKLKVSIGPKKQ